MRGRIGVLDLQSRSRHESKNALRLSCLHIEPLNKYPCTVSRQNGWVEIRVFAQFQGAQLADKMGHCAQARVSLLLRGVTCDMQSLYGHL